MVDTEWGKHLGCRVYSFLAFEGGLNEDGGLVRRGLMKAKGRRRVPGCKSIVGLSSDGKKANLTQLITETHPIRCSSVQSCFSYSVRS